MGTKFKGRKERTEQAPGQRSFAKAEKAQTKNPLFKPGTWIVEYLGCEELPPVSGKNEWIRFDFKHDGKTKSQLYCLSSKSASSTMPRIKSLCMALVGCDDEDEYNDFDPKGDFYAALLGYKNKFSKRAAEMVGETVKIIVTRGGDTDTGDYFRNASFEMAEDGDEDEPGEDDEDERPRKTGKKKASSKRGRSRDEDEDEDDEEDEDEDEDEEDDEDEDEAPRRSKKKRGRR